MRSNLQVIEELYVILRISMILTKVDTKVGSPKSTGLVFNSLFCIYQHLAIIQYSLQTKYAYFSLFFSFFMPFFYTMCTLFSGQFTHPDL